MLRTAIATLVFACIGTAFIGTPAVALAEQPISRPDTDDAASPSVPANKIPATLSDIAEWRMPEMPYPAGNPYSLAKQDLGRKLFFDPRLSGNPSRTCAACHHPGLGWADSMPRALGNQQGLGRHTPSLINVGFYTAFFWDGRASTLEDAVRQDLLSPGMGNDDTAEHIAQRVSSITAYRKEFAHAFPIGGVSFEHIAQALATYLRGIRSSATPFDSWLMGDVSAISASARRGFDLFRGKANCVQCHAAPNFTDSSFHNTGTNTVDPGHYEISGKDEDRNAFKTPQLRDIALSPPYMHNGSMATLAEVIDYYDRGGVTLDGGNELKPLHLSEQEKADLLAFLLSLSGQATETLMPALPLALVP